MKIHQLALARILAGLILLVGIRSVSFAQEITQFQLPAYQYMYPLAITADSDGIWYANNSYTTSPTLIGKLGYDGQLRQEIPFSNGFVNGMVMRDGVLWMTSSKQGFHRIASLDASGTIREYPMPDEATVNNTLKGITVGPDRNIWFTQYAAWKIGRLVPETGQITSFAINTDRAFPQDIAAGPDGALWFTEYTAKKIGRITVDGLISEYPLPPLPTSVCGPKHIAPADDGMYFTVGCVGDNRIGHITMSGVITLMSISTTTHNPLHIRGDSHNRFWFGSVTTTAGYANSKGFREYTLPWAQQANVVGADGNIWFLNFSSSRLARFVPPPAVSITNTELPIAWNGLNYDTGLSAVNGAGTLTWSVVGGSLPPGLSLSSDGHIRGIPSAVGEYEFSVKVIDDELITDTKVLTIRVANSLTIDTSSLPSGSIGVPYSAQLAATGSGALSWAVAGGSLPNGLEMSTNGLISGSPQSFGTFRFTVLVTDNNGFSASKELSIIVGNLRIVTPSLARAKLNKSYNRPVKVAGGKKNYTWAIVSGELPPGLNLVNAGSGVNAHIRGKATELGTYNFSLQVTDRYGAVARRDFTITVAIR